MKISSAANVTEIYFAKTRNKTFEVTKIRQEKSFCSIAIFTRIIIFRLTIHQVQWRIQDFPQEGALTPKGGRQPIIWPIFSENCMKMKKFWARGGARVPCAPLRSATEVGL